MQWQQIFRDHLQFIGEYWVDGGQPLVEPLPFDPNSMKSKKEELGRRGAEIVQTTVRATVDQLKEEQDDRIIDYHLLIGWLIRQNGQLYLEERCETRQVVIREQRILTDQLIARPTDEESVSLSSLDADQLLNRQGRRYDRLQAIRYAEIWWNRRNPAFPRIENDCTNFVSQCLFAGGIAMNGMPRRGRGWWQQKTNWSYSWAVANSLRWYLSNSRNIIGSVEVENAARLVPGDVICYDFEGDGQWNHNTFVTARDPSGLPLVSAHTYDARNRSWDYRDSPAWTANIHYKFFHILDK